MDKGILPRAVRLEQVSGCKVEGVFEDGVLGTILNSKRENIGTFDIKAKKIILSAGSVGTPELLLQSGFDKNNSQIGKGLHLHPVISTWGLMPTPINKRGATQGHFCDQFADDWVLLESNPVIGGAFFQALPIYGNEAIKIMKKASHFITTGALVKDSSEGQVHLPDNGTSKINYALNETDRGRLVKGLRAAAQLYLERPGLRQLFHLFGGQWCRNMSDVDKHIRRLSVHRLIPYSSHCQASCRMGRARSDGRLLGTKYLRNGLFCITI